MTVDVRLSPGERRAVVVVGGGQAGLSISYLLQQRGVDHLVLEKHRMGHAWRSERWDSFCLVTPNWQCRLPGHAYTGDSPTGFMGREEIVEYLERYRASFDPPLLEGVEVSRLRRATAGFVVETSAGSLVADQIVVATGGYHRPRIPDAARALPEGIVQLHSRDYKSPAALPPGPVLVVGTGQSGCQIAEDLWLAGREVHLSVGRAPRCARRYRGRDVVEWLEAMGHYELPVDDHPLGADVREKTNHYVTGRDGGHDLDLRAFALEGMTLHGSLRALRGGELCFEADLADNLASADEVYDSINRAIDAFIEKQGIEASGPTRYEPVWQPSGENPPLPVRRLSTIIWATGFDSDYRWVEAPVFDGRGRVVHERGVTAEPGLYFLGLPWLYTWGSGRFCGVGRDAEHLLQHLLGRLSSQTHAAEPALAVPTAPG